jgi:hypothetical protein
MGSYALQQSPAYLGPITILVVAKIGPPATSFQFQTFPPLNKRVEFMVFIAACWWVITKTNSCPCRPISSAARAMHVSLGKFTEVIRWRFCRCKWSKSKE